MTFGDIAKAIRKIQQSKPVGPQDRQIVPPRPIYESADMHRFQLNRHCTVCKEEQ